MRFLRRVLCLTVIFCLVLGMLSMTFADDAPSDEPTEAPTDAPTAPPTEEPPTESETPAPTEEPPTEAPTPEPTEAPPAPTTPQPPAPTSTRPWTPTPTQPWSPTPTEPPTESETWPWDSNEERAAVIHVDLPRPVSVPDDTNIESRGEDGRVHYTIPGTWTASDVISWFVLNYGLDSENFAVSFYCPETGERYGWNEDTYMIGASTYKLPLNMYYYEKQNAGEWSADMKVGGMTLAQAHYYSIVLSMNPISQAMFKRLGSYDTYRSLMLEHYGGMDKREVPAEYFSQNYFSPRFMINTLSYPYEHLAEFEELHDYMLQAMQDRYLQKYRGSVEVAHKYGTLQGHENDVGIVFTEQPFLVAIYTQYVYTPIRGEELIGRIGTALIAYQTQRTELDKPEPTEETPETETPGTEETVPPETEPPVETTRETAPAAPLARAAASPSADSGTPWYFIVFPLLILVGAVAGIVVFKKR